ncbi:hypothetical protein B0682_07955 [Moraxella lincolnii]|uniref:Low-complexity protein n=1 Tax=Lwoffella lincolnii TaxID=90241 RepID=A0A1T0CC12_9GAMM|nr:hypothetical protein [Moraxella lincolnii]OOS19864.1 hypothetical protein B0682_07955 [Moraxella lincolnii]
MKTLNKSALLAASAVLLSTTVAHANPFTAKNTQATECKKDDRACLQAKAKAAKVKAKNTEAKCGEAKCGASTKTSKAPSKNTEAKCGEAKCGASH